MSNTTVPIPITSAVVPTPIESLSISSSSSSSSSSSTTLSASEPGTPVAPPTPTTPPAPLSTTISAAAAPPTTQVITSVVTATPTAPGGSATAVTVVITRTNSGSQVPIATGASGSSTTSGSPALNTGGSSQSGGGKSGGLGTAGVTAIAVVVPVVVVALLVLAGLFLWRKRKQKKAAEEQRRKEVEDYGFNPNNDPTLPGVVSESGHEMAEDNSGYRGWGAATGSSRKMSTTLSGGHTQGQLSEAGSNPYNHGAGSPTGGTSDGHSGEPMLHQRRETMNSDIGSLGQGPIAGAGISGVKRGPSNASSTYSAGGHTDISDEGPGPQDSGPQSYTAYNPASGYGYGQHGPYGDGPYGATGADGMPVVQDVSARRNTRIQQPGNYQQGNSGIAQNF